MCHGAQTGSPARCYSGEVDSPDDVDDDIDFLKELMISVSGEPITIWDEIWLNLEGEGAWPAFLADISAVSRHQYGVMLQGERHVYLGHGVFPPGTFPCGMIFRDRPSAAGLRRAWQAGFPAFIVPLAPPTVLDALNEEHGQDCLDEIPDFQARGEELLIQMRDLASEGLAGVDFTLRKLPHWHVLIELKRDYPGKRH